jgi:hypothetical protein
MEMENQEIKPQEINHSDSEIDKMMETRNTYDIKSRTKKSTKIMDLKALRDGSFKGWGLNNHIELSREERKTIYNQKWYAKHRDVVIKKNNERQKNRDRITMNCEICGSSYNDNYHKRHVTSKRHLMFLSAIQHGVIKSNYSLSVSPDVSSENVSN